jgi:hypothetical protein
VRVFFPLFSRFSLIFAVFLLAGAARAQDTKAAVARYVWEVQLAQKEVVLVGVSGFDAPALAEELAARTFTMPRIVQVLPMGSSLEQKLAEWHIACGVLVTRAPDGTMTTGTRGRCASNTAAPLPPVTPSTSKVPTREGVADSTGRFSMALGGAVGIDPFDNPLPYPGAGLHADVRLGGDGAPMFELRAEALAAYDFQHHRVAEYEYLDAEIAFLSARREQNLYSGFVVGMSELPTGCGWERLQTGYLGWGVSRDLWRGRLWTETDLGLGLVAGCTGRNLGCDTLGLGPRLRFAWDAPSRLRLGVDLSLPEFRAAVMVGRRFGAGRL